MFQKYYENRLSVIPISKTGKNPVIPNWSQYCTILPPEHLVEQWEKNSHLYNIGICCGKASNIIVLDIDDDSLLDKCQPSPIRRRGKKGEARFFKYNPNIKLEHRYKVDILTDGSQILVPPSIHPETGKPYKWLTRDTLENFDTNDLPELDLLMLPKEISTNTKDIGRNNKFVDIITAKRYEGYSDLEIVDYIYHYDIEKHEKRLFADTEESTIKSAKNEYDIKLNALRMVNSVTKSLLDKKDFKIYLPEIKNTEDLLDFKAKEYPEPEGLLKETYDLMRESSPRKMEAISLGGAIALFGAIYSNRFRFNHCWTNVYCLNLAPTGSGKSIPQVIISKLLIEYLRSDIYGHSNYKSSSAFTKNLISKRIRLDVIDEISSLFIQIKKGGVYQVEILEEMCKAWTASNGYYSAGEYSEKENTSTCYNPCISILGSSTISGIVSTIDQMTITKGLIPRFLIFLDEDYGKFRANNFINEDNIQKLANKISHILIQPFKYKTNCKDILKGGDFGNIFDPINLAPKDKKTLDYFTEMQEDFAKKVELEKKDSLKHMYTRGIEQVIKLSTIHAAGCGRHVKIRDLEWAYNVFETSLFNASPMLEESSAVGTQDKFYLRLKKEINRYHKKSINMKFIKERFQGFDQKTIDATIDFCVKNQILQLSFKNNNKKWLVTGHWI